MITERYVNAKNNPQHLSVTMHDSVGDVIRLDVEDTDAVMRLHVEDHGENGLPERWADATLLPCQARLLAGQLLNAAKIIEGGES